MNEKTRKREENTFRCVPSKTGEFNPHLSKATAQRINHYCKATNQNRTKFVEKCINDMLDRLEMELYEAMSKEDLIQIILHK